MSYRYELIIYENTIDEKLGKVGRKVRRFIGNNLNELEERFQRWFIHSCYTLGDDTSQIYVYRGEIQHAGYKKTESEDKE